MVQDSQGDPRTDPPLQLQEPHLLLRLRPQEQPVSSKYNNILAC